MHGTEGIMRGCDEGQRDFFTPVSWEMRDRPVRSLDRNAEEGKNEAAHRTGTVRAKYHFEYNQDARIVHSWPSRRPINVLINQYGTNCKDCTVHYSATILVYV